MTSLSSPMEALLSAAQTVLGRACSFMLACHIGTALGFLIPLIIFEGPGSLTLEALGILVIPWLSVAIAFTSLFAGWGLLVYPLSLAVMMAFIRLELSFKWLWLPVSLIAIDTAFVMQSVGM